MTTKYIFTKKQSYRFQIILDFMFMFIMWGYPVHHRDRFVSESVIIFIYSIWIDALSSIDMGFVVAVQGCC